MEKVNHSETHCPSCGKFTGTYERCPYCGSEVQKRLSIRFFKYGSVFLAVIGVFFIYLASTKKNIEVTDLSNITETMNFAFVKLRGTVEGNPRIYRNDRNQVSGMNFSLLTGTTEVRVRAYSGVARDLVEQHKVPLDNEEITLMGSLRLKNAGNDIDIYLQAPEHLMVEPKRPVDKPFWELTANDKGKQAHISAIVDKVIPSETSAPNIVKIVSENGKKSELVV
ncbi:MAG: hypothetical protein ACOCWO_00740, partial [Candidatus Muiribacteriaceae bacterium]